MESQNRLADQTDWENRIFCFLMLRVYQQWLFWSEELGYGLQQVRCFIKFYSRIMEKPSWKKIEVAGSKPSPRWGHTCCVIGEEIVFFGGYADSHYMNDLWTYHAATQQWKEIATTGDKPAQRSNCSMNYDPLNNQLVIFGGGGSNKQRFNSVSVLDWKTKNWIEIPPKENEPGPWERTYHTAELKFPYLAVFGGEGVSDLEDLWIFSFLTLRWQQVKLAQDATRPCARRFHSSCLIGNEMFIIAGCYAKYRCLSDIYSMDLSPLLETGSIQQLKWVQRKPRGASFISRWGHSSAVYDGKIYVFAGRFSNDLNDVLVIDVQNNSLKTLKTGNAPTEAPKARRRHCVGFVGSCMIAFGGFNGEYYNDLHYINVFELNSRVDSSLSLEEIYKRYVNCETHSDGVIFTNKGEPVRIHSGLLARYFKSFGDFTSYLSEVNRAYDLETLTSNFDALYRGYGKLTNDHLHMKYNIVLTETYNRRIFLNTSLQNEEENESHSIRAACLANERSNDPVIILKFEEFSAFMLNRRNQWSADCTLKMGAQNNVRANRLLLTLGSTYFGSLLSGNYKQTDKIDLSHQGWRTIPFDILINYLMIGTVVVPENFSLDSWMELAQMADYFCLSHLRNICESQLCQRIQHTVLNRLQHFSEKQELRNLALHCANFELRRTERPRELKQKMAGLQKIHRKSCEIGSSYVFQLYETLKFDLLHKDLLEGKENKKQADSETSIEEKENSSLRSNFLRK